MKRFNKSISLALFAAIAIFHVKCSQSGDANSYGAAEQNDLPMMVVTPVNGTKVNINELTGKVILILFQTDCDHCQREATAIQKNISAFQAYTLYFVTTTSPTEIDAFANQYKLAGYSNVHFCRTSNQSILESFGPIDAPSLYIYSDKKLVKSFNGETSINEILKYI